MNARANLCYRLSLPHLDRPVEESKAALGDYQAWRNQSLSTSWTRFDDDLINGRKVLDFGCGDGQLSLFLATTRQPRSVTGVDLLEAAIARANEMLRLADPAIPVTFVEGQQDRLPFDDASFDTILAFDCLEHVMEPGAILADWSRVLAPGGHVVIEWFPFKGPWGPHMESLVPIPWAHLLFGERAMFEAAERLYDHPRFQPRHWDRDATGRKLPNKWRQWRSFSEQAYVNQLSLGCFREMAKATGFSIERLDRFGIGGARGKISKLGRAVARIPWLGEYLTSYCLIVLHKGSLH